jgi:hypothetical protein
MTFIVAIIHDMTDNSEKKEQGHKEDIIFGYFG